MTRHALLPAFVALSGVGSSYAKPVLHIGVCGSPQVPFLQCAAPDLAVKAINSGEVKLLDGATYDASGNLEDFEIHLHPNGSKKRLAYLYQTFY